MTETARIALGSSLGMAVWAAFVGIGIVRLARARAAGRKLSLRRIAFFAWSALAALAFGVAIFGLFALLFGWGSGQFGTEGPMTEEGHGVLFGGILTVAFLLQLIAPEENVAAQQQAILGTVALLLSTLVGSYSEALSTVISVAIALVAASLHPARAQVFRLPGAVNLPVMLVAAAGAPAWIFYALSMGAQSRTVVGPPHHRDHLTEMAAMAIAIVLLSLLAAAKTRGWRVPAWCAGSGAVVFGLASAAFSGRPGSAGLAWGMAALIWGLILVVVSEWNARRPQPLKE